MDRPDRRSLLAITLSGLVAGWLRPRDMFAGQATSTEPSARPRSFLWRVPVAHFQTVRDQLRFEGHVETEKDSRGSPIVYIFVGVLLLPYLANALLALRRDIIHGGLVIDTRGSEIVIDNDPRLDGGVIVVVTEDKVYYFERDEIIEPDKLLAALRKSNRD